MSDGVFVQAVEIVNGTDLANAVPQHFLRDLRRADDFIRLAVATGAALLSSLPDESSLPEATGIFVGTTIGPLETNFRFLDTLIDDGEGQGSPTLFSHSVHNSAAGYVARLFNIRGPALTVTTYGWPFLSVLAEAAAALAARQLQAALVIGVEEEAPLLVEALGRSEAEAGAARSEVSDCRKGAVGWLLIAEPLAGEKGTPRLCGIDLAEQMVEPADYLARPETFSSSAKFPQSEVVWPDALAGPVNLTQAVVSARKEQRSRFEWRLGASFGKARGVVEF